MTSAGWSEGDVDDVGLVDLDLGGDDGHVGERHQGGALGVLDADDDGFAFADGHVGDDAVEGGDGDGLVERVEVGAQRGHLVFRWPRPESVWALAWASAALALGEGGDGQIVGGLLGVVVLLGDELVLVERLGAIVVELLLLEVGLGLLDVGFGVFSAAM